MKITATPVSCPRPVTPGRNSGRNRVRDAVRAGPVTFTAVDGEGVSWCGHCPGPCRNTLTGCSCGHGQADHHHAYQMLGIGDRQLIRPEGLSAEEIFTFLWENRAEGGKNAYTGFFLGYDFTQWLRGLDEQAARMLLTKDGIAKRKRQKSGGNPVPFPVYVGGDRETCRWELDILASKRLKFRPGPAYRDSASWMYICDTGPFFQQSFAKVIAPSKWAVKDCPECAGDIPCRNHEICSSDEYEKVLAGKARRGGTVLTEADAEYNRLENAILARVLNRLQDGFTELGIRLEPDQWYGPGQAAQAWLDTTGLATAAQIRERVPQEFLDAGRMSYYGGWFEIFAHGIIPGTVWEYDINSAYPHAIANLPCLMHGTYRSGTGDPVLKTSRDLCLVRVRLTGKSRKIGPAPHRNSDGSIERPHRTTAWMHHTELVASMNAGLVAEYEITEWLAYTPCECPPPVAAVADLYALRKKVGKNTPLGIACKLVPNSLYGKFAQSIGTPKYANPVYASLITSSCRTQILDAIASHPHGKRDVVMVATDGVYFRTRHPSLPLSGNLGDWEEAAKENICLFKPGVYWDDKARDAIASGKGITFKARGVSAADLAGEIFRIDGEFRALAAAGGTVSGADFPVVEFPVRFRMTTALQACHRNQWHTAGQLVTGALGKQSSNPWLKRGDFRVENGIITSKSHLRGSSEENHPYDRTFGQENPDNPHTELNRSALGITPDGLPGDLVREALYEN